MRCVFLVLILTCAQLARAQDKPVLPLDYSNAWPSLNEPTIANDGEHAYFYETNLTPGITEFFLWTRASNRAIAVPGVLVARFSPDGKFLFYKRSDTVVRRNLATGRESFYTGIAEMTELQKDRWFLFTMKNDGGFSVVDAATGKIPLHFKGSYYQFLGSSKLAFYAASGGDLFLAD